MNDGGLDVNKRSSQGFAPLCIAAFWGYSDIVKLLLGHGYVHMLCSVCTPITIVHTVFVTMVAMATQITGINCVSIVKSGAQE